MKKAMILVIVIMLLSATTVVAFAGGEKVKVCHIIEANVVIPFGPGLLYFGKQISVSENAHDTHVAHGDSSTFFGGEEAAGPIAAFKAAGANLPAANCYYWVPN